MFAFVYHAMLYISSHSTHIPAARAGPVEDTEVVLTLALAAANQILGAALTQHQHQQRQPRQVDAVAAPPEVRIEVQLQSVNQAEAAPSPDVPLSDEPAPGVEWIAVGNSVNGSNGSVRPQIDEPRETEPAVVPPNVAAGGETFYVL